MAKKKKKKKCCGKYKKKKGERCAKCPKAGASKE